jgi:hypothetical protein
VYENEVIIGSLEFSIEPRNVYKVSYYLVIGIRFGGCEICSQSVFDGIRQLQAHCTEGLATEQLI